MTKEEALRELFAGKKITHRYFSDDEWITFKSEEEKLELEDGAKCSLHEFFMYRRGDEWETDWSIWEPNLKTTGE